MAILYLPNHLIVHISTCERRDNIVFSFQWNKHRDSLPFPEDIRDSIEEVVVYKNHLTLYLAKVIHLSNINREIIHSKLYNCIHNSKQDNVYGPTPSENYRAYLQDGCTLVSNKKKDIHLAIIETIWNLWI